MSAIRRLRDVSVALTVLSALTLAACGQAPPPSASRSTTPRSTGSVLPSRPGPSTSTPASPSAAPQLAAFIAAAVQADSQLRHAAALVNADITRTSMRFTPATVAAVRDLSNAPARRAIPAGLPTGLLRDVLVVYGDLSSRIGSFDGVRVYGSSGRELPIGGQDAQSVLRGLGNGSRAAAHFDADLAALRTLAQNTPPVTIASADSRVAADLTLRLEFIDRHNFCSEEFGGWVPATLETIVWQPTGDYAKHYEGTIAGIRFEADYTTAHGWAVDIHAC